MARKRRKRRGASSRRSDSEHDRPRSEPSSAIAAGLRWKAFWWLAAPVLVAATLRAVHFAFVANEAALAEYLILDSELHSSMADAIGKGDWLVGSQPFAVGPLYAYVLALLRSLLGPSHLAVIAVQEIIGLGSTALVTLLARRVSSPGGACAAGTAFALYAPTLMLESKILGETLAVFTTLLSTFMLVRGRFLLSGLSFGAACLLRPDQVLFVPLGCLFLARAGGLLGGLLGGAAPRQREPGSLGRRLAPIGAWLLPIVLLVGLCTARNVAVTGEPILISSQGGLTLYQGNNPRAEGTFSIPVGFSGNKVDQEREARTVAERATGRRLSHREVDGYWAGRAVEYAASNPGDALWLLGRKLWYWLASAELSGEYSALADRCLAPSLSAALVPFGALLAAALLGARTAWRADPRLVEWLGLVVLSGLLTGLIFFVSSRYRLVAAAHLAVLVGPAWRDLVQALGSRQLGRVAPSVALLVVSFLPARDAARFQAATSLYNLGGLHYQRGRYEDAIRYYLAAVGTRPKDWELRNNLGHAFAVVGDFERAAFHFEKVLELNPKAEDAERTLRKYRAASLSSPSQAERQPLCEL